MVEKDSRLAAPGSLSRALSRGRAALPSAMALPAIRRLARLTGPSSRTSGLPCVAALIGRIPYRHFRAVLQFVKAASSERGARRNPVHRGDIAVRRDRLDGLYRRSLVGI